MPLFIKSKKSNFDKEMFLWVFSTLIVFYMSLVGSTRALVTFSRLMLGNRFCFCLTTSLSNFLRLEFSMSSVASGFQCIMIQSVIDGICGLMDMAFGLGSGVRFPLLVMCRSVGPTSQTASVYPAVIGT